VAHKIYAAGTRYEQNLLGPIGGRFDQPVDSGRAWADCFAEVVSLLVFDSIAAGLSAETAFFPVTIFGPANVNATPMKTNVTTMILTAVLIVSNLAIPLKLLLGCLLLRISRGFIGAAASLLGRWVYELILLSVTIRLQLVPPNLMHSKT